VINRDDLLDWLANGETGISSEEMAFRLGGVKKKKEWCTTHPSDPDDLNRCIKFLVAVPSARESIGEMRAVSPEWRVLVDHWDELEKMFIEEVGFNWSKGKSAKKTYDRMQELFDSVRRKKATA